MDYIFEELVDYILSIFLFVVAIGLLISANQTINDADKLLPTNETVYKSMYQPINEITWKGSQVQYKLWEIEDLGIPIAVGGFVFYDEEDVIENVKLIFPNQEYSLQTTVDAEGQVIGMQFYIKQ